MYIQPTFTNGTYSVPAYGSDPFISGFRLKVTGGTTFTLSPGTARAYASNDAIIFNPFAQPGIGPLLTLDISTNGALGCFPIPLENLTLVNPVNLGVYVLGDTSGINPVTAIVATGNNFLLPGYNVWRRVGSVYINNATLELFALNQSGEGIERQYTNQVIITGAVYGPTTFFEIPISAGGPCNPNFATEVLIRRQFVAASLTDFSAISTGTTGATSNLSFQIKSAAFGGGATATDEISVPVGIKPNGDNVVYITVVGAGSTLTMFIFGWKESMGLQAV